MGVVTGTFQNSIGAVVSNGTFQFKLSNDAVVLGAYCNVPTLVVGNLDVNGNLAATITFNDILDTTTGFNTTYQLTVKDRIGGQVWNENYYFSGTAAVNLNNYLPSGVGTSALFQLVGVADSVQTFAATSAVGFAGAINTLVEATAGVAGITLTVASAIGVAGRTMRFIQMDTHAAGVLLTTTAGQTINGRGSWLLTNQYQYAQIESDNSNWVVVAWD